MDLREFVARSMVHTRQATLNMVQGLTAEELRWRPHPTANHVAFLLFHIFRGQDRYVHRWVGGVEEVWEAGGWAQRLPLPPPPPNAPPGWATGNSWTPEAVATWQPPPLGEILAYGGAAHESALAVVRGLDLGRLTEVPYPARPNMTVADYLRGASHHEAEHQGQIDYLLGLMKQALA